MNHSADGDPFYLQFGNYWFRASDDDEMYFSNTDCRAPPTFRSRVLRFRDREHEGIDVDPGAFVFRRRQLLQDPSIANGQTDADNSGAIQSKYQLTNSNFGELEGPACTQTVTTIPTVEALPVTGLHAFLAGLTKPFKIEQGPEAADPAPSSARVHRALLRERLRRSDPIRRRDPTIAAANLPPARDPLRAQPFSAVLGRARPSRGRWKAHRPGKLPVAESQAPHRVPSSSRAVRSGSSAIAGSRSSSITMRFSGV